MSRTYKISPFLSALCVCVASAQALAALPNQPILDPGPGVDLGPYSVTDQALGGNDPRAAFAYDNFSISSAYNLSGINWSGVFAEPLPDALSHVDFIVSIWGDDSGVPDVTNPAVLQWNLEAGFGGQTGPDVTATANGIVSPSTGTTEGGGPGFDYSAAIAGMLSAGDYWISIQADQLFDNVAPIVDPEWQWHLGDGPDDGFFVRDFALKRPLSKNANKDLAFSLEGTVVPEPSTLGLLFAAALAVGLLRRRP